MNRWIIVGGVVIALVGLLFMQQRRLDRLESAVKQAQGSAPSATASPAEGGSAPVFVQGDPSGGNRAPQIKFVPVPVPVAGVAPAAAPGTPAAAVPSGPAPVAPMNPVFANRGTLAERLAQTPAQPVMADTSPAIREFVQQNNIDQAQWNALVKANKDWVDTLVKAKQSGITSVSGPLDQLAKRHTGEVNTILGDKGVVDSYQKMQDKVTTPKVSVQFGGKTFDGTRIE